MQRARRNCFKTLLKRHERSNNPGLTNFAIPDGVWRTSFHGRKMALTAIPIAWFEFLTTPFGAFTFTDPQDFVFALLIPITGVLLVARHRRKPYPQKWVKWGAATAFVLAVVTPLVPTVMFYMMSRHAAGVIGHWPICMADDPKHICQGDALYHRLSDVTEYAVAFAGWGLFTWGGLMRHLWGSLSPRLRRWQMGIFLIAWAAFVWEPNGRFFWWMD